MGVSDIPTCTDHHPAGPRTFQETRCDGCGMRMWAYHAKKAEAANAKELELQQAKAQGRKPNPQAWESKLPGECDPHVHVGQGNRYGLPPGILYIDKVKAAAEPKRLKAR